MPRVVHFDISAEKPERAISFYEKVFGWKVAKWDGPIEYWLITTGKEDEPGIDGGLARRTEPEPSTVYTIDVSSIDEYLKKVKDNGGTIVTPKHAVPGVGWMADFKDPARAHARINMVNSGDRLVLSQSSRVDEIGGGMLRCRGC